ncbi:MAG TPA: hypothetical protein VL948_00905 [Verrucomicrobiae bacterium]|jgi:hypothetical protein|nr:hypothetical protein [Verrucomicrobiae bacterium]
MASDELSDLKMDPAALYREDVYTDRRMGTIRVMTPVTGEGHPDLTRAMLYVGETQILTSVGALPVVFEIEAKSLGEAAEKFADAAKVGVERTMRQLQELRREAASSIVVPDRMPPGLGGPGLGGPGLGGPGGMRGGGKIQLP